MGVLRSSKDFSIFSLLSTVFARLFGPFPFSLSSLLKRLQTSVFLQLPGVERTAGRAPRCVRRAPAIAARSSHPTAAELTETRRPSKRYFSARRRVRARGKL